VATYVQLINFTEQGVKNIKESPARAAAFRKQVEGAGGKVREIYWTLGKYDGVLIFDAPDDETAAALMLSLAGKGNAKTHTLRAFDEKEFSAVLKKVK
jgi:uncharacterized protein with GYD domain